MVAISISMPMLISNNLIDHNILSFDHKIKHFRSCRVAAPGLTTFKHCDQNPIQRRSGNYKPPTWDFDYIQSLKSDYSEERYSIRDSELKEQVTVLLDRAMESIDQLEFIDDLQQLGISYHFEEKINKQILTKIYNQKYLQNDVPPKGSDDLYTTALEFRLLRIHGFKVPQERFNCFKNEKDEFKSSLRNDIKGLLQLYEASYMLIADENTLEMAREFATSNLRNSLYNHDHGFGQMDESLSLMVRSALEIPLHWKVQRPNARWFINAYEKKFGSNRVVLEFAKLDFNIVQAKLLQELKHVSRWWKKTRLAEKLPFARDRLVECYFWPTGVLSDPQHGFARIAKTKVNTLITTIDDVYDVYGTLEELQLFTDVIQRWDIKAVDQLPAYMQLCFLALNNFINDMAYDVLKDQGFVIIPYLRKSWTDLCEAYLKEAEWYFQGYTPTLEEYIENAWISIGAHVILTHIFFAVTNPIKEDAVQDLYKYHDIVRWSSMILRLADDLGTSPEEMERGDVSKLGQCYMNETGASEKEAQEHVRFLICETWKKMNKERVAKSLFPQSFIGSAVDLGRMAQYVYQHGDGHGISNQQTQYRISNLLFEPIT